MNNVRINYAFACIAYGSSGNLLHVTCGATIKKQFLESMHTHTHTHSPSDSAVWTIYVPEVDISIQHMFHPRNCLHDSAPARPQRERQTPTRSHTRGGDLGCFNLASWLPQQTMSVLLRYLQKARKGTMSCQHDTARHVNRSSCTCRRSRII